MFYFHFSGASTISTISDTSSGYMVGEQESTSYSFLGTPANEVSVLLTLTSSDLWPLASCVCLGKEFFTFFYA